MRADRTKQRALARLAELEAFAAKLPPRERAAYRLALRRFRHATAAAAIAGEQAREAKRREQRRRQLMPALAARRSKSEINDADVAAQLEHFKLQRPQSSRWSAWRIAGEIIDAVNAARAEVGRAPLRPHTIYDKGRFLGRAR
jgi:hypothetical protein